MACIMWIGDRRTRRGHAGHEVYRARDVGAALAALEGLVFDVVVMPATLAVADQVAVCAALRADSVHGRTRVLAWSEAPRQRPPRVKRFSRRVGRTLGARQVASGK